MMIIFQKKIFFKKKKLSHKCKEIINKDWVNIYDLFTFSNKMIWPRGLPLDYIKKNKIKLKKGIFQNFYIQQGVCEKILTLMQFIDFLMKKLILNLKIIIT